MNEEVCNDCKEPADPEYTMRFDDIGEEPIYWCSACGQVARDMNELLEKKLEDPEFRAKFAIEIERAKCGGNQ